VRRGGDNFVDTARALFGTVVVVLNCQPSNRWQWVSVELKEGGLRYQEEPSDQAKSRTLS
jgi:hypothetical protein